MSKDRGWVFLNIKNINSSEYNGADGSWGKIYPDGRGEYNAGDSGF